MNRVDVLVEIVVSCSGKLAPHKVVLLPLIVLIIKVNRILKLYSKHFLCSFQVSN